MSVASRLPAYRHCEDKYVKKHLKFQGGEGGNNEGEHLHEKNLLKIWFQQIVDISTTKGKKKMTFNNT